MVESTAPSARPRVRTAAFSAIRATSCALQTERNTAPSACQRISIGNTCVRTARGSANRRTSPSIPRMVESTAPSAHRRRRLNANVACSSVRIAAHPARQTISSSDPTVESAAQSARRNPSRSLVQTANARCSLRTSCPDPTDETTARCASQKKKPWKTMTTQRPRLRHRNQSQRLESASRAYARLRARVKTTKPSLDLKGSLPDSQSHLRPNANAWRASDKSLARLTTTKPSLDLKGSLPDSQSHLRPNANAWRASDKSLARLTTTRASLVLAVSLELRLESTASAPKRRRATNNNNNRNQHSAECLAFRSHFYKIRNNIISHPFLLHVTSRPLVRPLVRPSVLEGKSRASSGI